jgi:hypothetical protein
LGGRRKTQGEFEQEVKNKYNNEYLVVGKYISATKKIKIYHSLCKNSYMITPNNFVNVGNKCPYCSKKHTSIVTKKNCLFSRYPILEKEWDFKKNKISPKEITYGSAKKVWWKCQRCGHEWMAKVRDRTNKKEKCPHCRQIYHIKGNNVQKFNPEIIKSFDIEKNIDINPKYLPPYSRKKYWWKCSKCHKSFYCTVAQMTVTGCQKCNCKKSKGQLRMENYLESISVRYKNEYKFNDCRDIRPLPFDICIKKKGHVVLLIEYDGEGHYRPIDWKGAGNEYALKRFVDYRKKDKIKNYYCIKKYIPLLRIPYWEFNDIEKIIKLSLTYLNIIHINKKISTIEKQYINKYLIFR